jgi:hypothetical protein
MEGDKYDICPWAPETLAPPLPMSLEARKSRYHTFSLNVIINSSWTIQRMAGKMET